MVITASHNPWQWNGLKFKASYGGSAAPEIIREIEAEMPRAGCASRQIPDGSKLAKEDLVGPYLQHIEKVIDLKAIARRNFLLVVDPMYGAE